MREQHKEPMEFRTKINIFQRAPDQLITHSKQVPFRKNKKPQKYIWASNSIALGNAMMIPNIGLCEQTPARMHWDRNEILFWIKSFAGSSWNRCCASVHWEVKNHFQSLLTIKVSNGHILSVRSFVRIGSKDFHLFFSCRSVMVAKCPFILQKRDWRPFDCLYSTSY